MTDLSASAAARAENTAAQPIVRTHSLSDQLRERLESLKEDIAEGLVPAWVFASDPEVYELERERLFPRVWTFVGHESELKEKGEYRIRYVGEDSFIFVRGQDDKIRLLFNACRHRGAQVCATEAGTNARFSCPYHGWTYSNDGRLVAITSQKEAADGIDKDEWGLLEATRLETYHGFYFACLDPDAPSLEEFMGDAKFYMDMYFQLFDDLEVVGVPQRSSWPTTWKAGYDGFGDDYHLITLHRSLFETGSVTIPFAANVLGHHVVTGGGHNITISIAPSDETAFWGYPQEVFDTRDWSKLDETQADLARRSRVFVGTLFPNFSWLIIPLTGSPDGYDAQAFAEVRLWRPAGDGQMEVWNWIMVPKGASDEFREMSQRAAIQTFSSSGVFDQDDSVAGRGMNRTGTAVFGRGMKLNYQAGYKIGTAEPVKDWPGPGIATTHRYEENSFRYSIKQWAEYLLSDDYPELLKAPQGEFD